MPISKITVRGQTTIPSEIRKALHLLPHDHIVYFIEGDRIVIKPLKGDIMELRGKLKLKKKLNFKNLRDKTKNEITKKIIKEGVTK